MKRQIILTHEFVEYIPNDLEDGIVYVSMGFAAVVHKCCCGCGNEVVTPLSPTDWKLTFDGQSISLYPSIGNWSFTCQSHYWIKENRVKWVAQWSQQEINDGREQDLLIKERYFASTNTPSVPETIVSVERARGNVPKKSLWKRLKNWLGY